MMTQTPSGLWIARLLLIPGPYSARVHITEFADDTPGRVAVHRCWDVDFNVPDLTGCPHVTPEIRIWLHEPGDAAAKAGTNQDYL
jgi:hypothetical protein